MNPQVIMSRWNGNIAVAHPVCLMPQMNIEEGYALMWYGKPPEVVGYLLDCGLKNLQFCNSKTLEKNVEWLGDL